jgi:hypothetical protein
VSEPRPEHGQAVTWLNQSRLTDFYLLKMEALVIGDSLPAPLLTKIVGPTAETAEVGESRQEFAERHHLRMRFWSEFIPRARAHGFFGSDRTTTRDNWMDRSEGPFSWNVYVRQHDAQVTLYVDGYGEGGNTAFIRTLEGHASEIETAFGSSLEWDEGDGRKHAKVSAILLGGGYRDEETWATTHERMLAAYTKLSQAIQPFLAEARDAAVSIQRTGHR